MSDIETEIARLEKELQETLFVIVGDDSAPDATRKAAGRILREQLNNELQRAIGNFQANTMKLVDLVDQLKKVVDGLATGVPAGGVKATVPKLINQAGDLLRRVHDAHGMRTTHMTPQQAEENHSDEEMLPPLTSIPGHIPPPLTTLNGSGEVLRAPQPTNSTRYEVLADEYVRFFLGADFKNAKARADVDQNAALCLRFKSTYEEVGNPLGIPWWFIAGIHMLESSFNFTTHLHNGDPLSGRTVRVPPGRPKVWNPPNDWASSARDALSKLAGQKDWSLPRALYRWEAYNGFGYRPRSVASPYLWSLSTIYGSGKYVRDGEFDAGKESEQCGAASMLKCLHQQGKVVLTLDRMSEVELAPSLDAMNAAKDAIVGGRTTIDTVLPANVAFEQFLRQNLSNLTHFKPVEFLMMGGGQDNSLPPQELWSNVVPLVKVLDELRSRLGNSIVLTSVYRSEAHNSAVGGVKGSQHSRFCAADFQAAQGTPREWAAVLRMMREAKLFQGGIGLYSSFVHIDTRGWNADW